MRILDVLNSPWAISSEALIEIQSIYRTHFRGEKIDWKALEAKAELFKPTNKDSKPYEVINGIAVIEISGVLTKGMSFLSWLFGGSSMQQIGNAYQAAISDPQVQSIMLHIDSPGGTVDGTQELADIIYFGKNEKPVIAYSDGQISSAAYWLASAADKIYISGDTNSIGSIGIKGGHVDVSKQEEMAGEKYTDIAAGKYKVITSSHAPLSPEGRQNLQDMVDYIYTVFVGAVARNRNISIEQALNMADGRTFIGKQAVEVGLVDGVSTFDQVINNMLAGAPHNKFKAEEENQIMDQKELKEKHPDIYQAILEEGRSSVLAQVAAAKTEGLVAGAETERKRISAIQTQTVPGHEQIIAEAIADGTSTAGDVAMKILSAEKTIRTNKGADAEADAAGLKKVKTVASETEEKDGKGKSDFMAEVEKYQEEKKCTHGEAIKAVANAKPELHQKYLVSVNPGKKVE